MAANPPASAFASMIRSRSSEILERWEQQARTRGFARGLDRDTLRDHLPAVIEDIADGMEAMLAGRDCPRLHNEPEQHALHRLEQGRQLADVVTEYSLLRDVILQLATGVAPTPAHEVRILDDVIDRALAQAARCHARGRERRLEALDRISQLVFVESKEDELLHQLIRLMMDGFVGLVAARREPIFVRCAENDALVEDPFLKVHGYKAVYAVPLVDGADLLGVAHMGSSTAYEIADEDRMLFRAMANRMAQVIIEARLKASLRQQKDELRREHERLRLVLRLAELGTFCRDLRTGALELDDRARVLLGCAPDEEPTRERILSRIRARDREPLDAAFSAARCDEELRVRFVLVRPNGEAGHLELRGGVAEDAGRRAQVMGIVLDRTRDHEAETEREIFLAALGHDLRNPLQAISMGAAAIVRFRSLPDAVTSTARLIARASTRMSRLIDQLLDFAKVRAGAGITLNRRPTDAAELWKQIVDEAAMSSPGRRILLETQAATLGEWDPDRLLQVFQNLLANAITYGEEGKPITISLTSDSKQLRCEVHNVGPPIPAETISVIFDPFRRGRSGGAGIGLGLAIARQIVVAHGGFIEVTSSAGEGTSFSLRLPREPDVALS